MFWKWKCVDLLVYEKNEMSVYNWWLAEIGMQKHCNFHYMPLKCSLKGNIAYMTGVSRLHQWQGDVIITKLFSITYKFWKELFIPLIQCLIRVKKCCIIYSFGRFDSVMCTYYSWILKQWEPYFEIKSCSCYKLNLLNILHLWIMIWQKWKLLHNLHPVPIVVLKVPELQT